MLWVALDVSRVGGIKDSAATRACRVDSSPAMDDSFTASDGMDEDDDGGEAAKVKGEGG